MQKLEHIEVQFKKLKDYWIDINSHNSRLQQRLQTLESEMQRREVVLSQWSKDKAQLEQHRLLLSHQEAERIQLQQQIMSMKQQLQEIKKERRMLEVGESSVDKEKEIAKLRKMVKDLQGRLRSNIGTRSAEGTVQTAYSNSSEPRYFSIAICETDN